MKRVFALASTQSHTDDRRPKKMRYTLKTPPSAVTTREDNRRFKDVVRRVGKQAGYNSRKEYEKLLKSSIENRQILADASGNTGDASTMELLACVSVAAKMDVNFAFDLERASFLCVNDRRLNQFVQAELTIVLKAPPLRCGAMRIIKDSTKYWKELKK